MAGVVLLVPVCVLAVIGAAHTSADALIGWSLVGLGAGILVAVGAPRLRRGRQIGMHGPDLPLGVAAAATFVTVCLVIAGLLAAFGGGLTTAALLLFAVSGLWAGNHHRPRARATPVANPHDVLAAVTLPASSTLVADMGTEELCVAWRRSYYQLVLATDEPARRLVVQRRQEFLDEIERRDGRGFRRWLDSGARAGGDPGPYLTTRS
ncbi:MULTISPECIES: hypothetical protein [unclassified Amycolatopsis]|uniref:hypothetical protein n=1 Tax=unclassified Amycolatopsis TaxID=2618356 RepID=UPI002E106CC1|nr:MULTISPECIES: hypothetical protein [unclassified Amycolatopsis]WSJ78618.1 hypothetical protein OG439_06425 [Amycolatopsis sp. NBC_01307]WSK77828.1 hypothetical protein OG570_41720 [Amycolatopsis sp. NBC_01286]